MFGVGRDLCGSPGPTPLPKQDHVEQVAQDRVQAGLEYLQRRRLAVWKHERNKSSSASLLLLFLFFLASSHCQICLSDRLRPNTRR